METVPNSAGRNTSGGRTKPIVRVRAKASEQTAPAAPRSRRRRRSRGGVNTTMHRSPSAPANNTAPPQQQSEYAVAPAWLAISRAVAMFLGLITLLNLFGDLHLQSRDANFWWINLEPWPVPVARGLLATTSVLLFLFAAQVNSFKAIRYLTMLTILTLMAVAGKETFQFYANVKAGTITTTAPFPVAAYTLLMLGIVFCGQLLGPRIETNSLRTFVLGTFTCFLCCAGFPIAQMYCSGQTDLQREADVAVIFGTPDSEKENQATTLADTVRTGCELYNAGRVKKLILTGGSTSDDVPTTTTMQQLAIKFGVPKADLVIDTEGTTIKNGISNVATLLETQEQKRLLAVSPFHRLPRIQLRFEQAGLLVSTVPVNSTDTKKLKRETITTEVIALWKTYVAAMTKR